MKRLRAALPVLVAILAMAWHASSLRASPTQAPPVSFSGHGDTSTAFFPLDTGLVTARYTHNGQRNFIVHGLHSSGQETLFLANEIGVTTGSSLDRVGMAGSYLLSIDADGDWTITIEQPRPTSAVGAPQTYTGQGREISPFIQLGSGIVTVRGAHNGQSNFIVHLVDHEGFTEEFVFNEIGAFNGAKSFAVPDAGVYLFEIQADGNWTIGVEQTTGVPGPTPTPTPRPQPVCSPRPRVAVAVANSGSGQLSATITATGSNNFVRELHFGPATNAQISAAGQSGTGNFTVLYPSFPTSVSFTVQRSQAGLPMHVPLDVIDGCGVWRTFVGAGTRI